MERKRDLHSGLTRREVLRYGLHGTLATIGGGLWSSGCGRRQQKKKPANNILFVLIDALRADRMGVYGHPGGHTPRMDAIASEGVVFERAIAQAPWTQPSMASLFCSRYPGAHKVLDYDQAKASYLSEKKVAVFGDSFVTLAEVLQQGGYDTAGFVANPYIVSGFGFAQGFDHFDDSFAKNTTPGNVVNEAALGWLRQRDTDKPFFCFLHYMDVHGPYNSGPEFLEPLLNRVNLLPRKRLLTKPERKKLGYLDQAPAGYEDLERNHRLSIYHEYWAARYDAGIRQADYHIGQLNSCLAQMGLWDDTYVIITADHGEALAEHGHWDHGFSVHHPELHVPLILRWPGVLAPGQRIDGTVQLIDLMPTMIDQLELSEVNALQGRSVKQQIETGSAVEPTTTMAEGVKAGPEQKAIYLDGWKLIITPTVGQRELYHVAEDPLEQINLSFVNSEKVAQLLRILQEQMEINEKLASKVPEKGVLLTPQQKERLRSLGYLK